jgi:hypothetical protein
MHLNEGGRIVEGFNTRGPFYFGDNLDGCPSPFVLHTTHGVPLSISCMILTPRGFKPNLARFYFESVLEGWSEKTAMSVIREACRDNDLEFNEQEFLGRAELLWMREDNVSKLVEMLDPYIITGVEVYHHREVA